MYAPSDTASCTYQNYEDDDEYDFIASDGTTVQDETIVPATNNGDYHYGDGTYPIPAVALYDFEVSSRLLPLM